MVRGTRTAAGALEAGGERRLARGGPAERSEAKNECRRSRLRSEPSHTHLPQNRWSRGAYRPRAVASPGGPERHQAPSISHRRGSRASTPIGPHRCGRSPEAYFWLEAVPHQRVCARSVFTVRRGACLNPRAKPYALLPLRFGSDTLSGPSFCSTEVNGPKCIIADITAASFDFLGRPSHPHPLHRAFIRL